MNLKDSFALGGVTRSQTLATLHTDSHEISAFETSPPVCSRPIPHYRTRHLILPVWSDLVVCAVVQITHVIRYGVLVVQGLESVHGITLFLPYRYPIVTQSEEQAWRGDVLHG